MAGIPCRSTPRFPAGKALQRPCRPSDSPGAGHILTDSQQACPGSLRQPDWGGTGNNIGDPDGAIAARPRFWIGCACAPPPIPFRPPRLPLWTAPESFHPLHFVPSASPLRNVGENALKKFKLIRILSIMNFHCFVRSGFVEKDIRVTID